MKNNILILGATGMLGHVVYAYLAKVFPKNVWGTTRKKRGNSDFFVLNVSTLENNLCDIIKKIGKLNYVINCIGVFKNTTAEELLLVNATFPKKLTKLALENNFKIIHVSSDAVFPPNSGEINELDVPRPIDDYGKSKLKGEIDSRNLISIRTSIVGLDPIEHKGLLEWITHTTSPVPGYTNQLWAGCTSLQFAKLCEDIIVNNKFDTFRELSPVFHFTPIGPIIKYQIINDFVKISKINKSVQKQKCTPISRLLKSLYFDYLSNKKYTNDIKKALEELIIFEEKVTTNSST